MYNRSPSDNTIVGIAENIAEIERLPKLQTKKQEEINTSTASLDAQVSVERDFTDNKIPYQNRQMTALVARIAMLQLPANIDAIKEKVKADTATIANAEKERSINERDVQPHRDEHKKIQNAIDLLVSLAYSKNALAASTSSLEAKTAELARLKTKLTELEPRRDSAHLTATKSKEILDNLDYDLQTLRKRHRDEEEPQLETVRQLKNRLDGLHARNKIAMANHNAAHDHQHDEEKAERKHLEKSQQALSDKQKFHAHADAEHKKKRSLLAELENQRRAYESAKQAAAYSSSSNSSGGYGSSGNAAPPSTTTTTISVGFGAVVQVPAAPPSTFSSDQGGSNSNTTYSANVSNNGNVLEDMLQKISRLERDIQSAEAEAKRYERKAAAEHEDALSHEAKAATAHQHAMNYADQVRTYAEQASSLQTEIVRTNRDYEHESDRLNQIQQRIRGEDSKLSKKHDTAYQQHKNDHAFFAELNSNCVETTKLIEQTKQSIANLDRDIANTKSKINNTDSLIKADEYATQHSEQTLIAMRKEQEKLVQPYLNKIEECRATINNTSVEKQSKLSQIDDLEKQLRTATSTVEKSTPEFAAICSSEDIPNLQKQSTFAESELAQFRQQLAAQRERIASNRSQLKQLQSELTSLQNRERNLHAADLLMRLYRDPGNELNALHRDLLAAIRNYSATHHVGLSWQSRSSLLSLENRANFIFQNDDVDGQTDKDKLREKFYQLSGLIRNEIEFISGNPSYFNVLSGLLTHRDVEERNVVARFHKLEEKYPQPLHIMNYAEITNYDTAQYNNAKAAFDHLLAAGPQQNTSKWRSLYRAGKSISSCIHKEEIKVRAPNDIQFDVHLHTRIFQLASEVLQSPNNAAARSELHDLTHPNMIGKPSTARKVVGAILSFIGAAAALVGGLALAALIPGISLPIAAPLIAGGGAGVAVGLFTFFSGLERGLSRAYTRFDNISADLGNHMPRPAPSAPPKESEQPSEYFEPPTAPPLHNM